MLHSVDGSAAGRRGGTQGPAGQNQSQKDDIRLREILGFNERRIKNLLGLQDMYDIPGMTELYGPGTGLECRSHDGMHYWADYYILEIVDPDNSEPVAPGEIGEMVVTTLRKEAVPLSVTEPGI